MKKCMLCINHKRKEEENDVADDSFNINRFTGVHDRLNDRVAFALALASPVAVAAVDRSRRTSSAYLSWDLGIYLSSFGHGPRLTPMKSN
mmetsp:Transcript_16383/g.35638  ORF Transcript_16383/g.35638 Transcript_16383/m.35638 type:complete len:90 (+) Transcript_16383:208-477(+)